LSVSGLVSFSVSKPQFKQDKYSPNEPRVIVNVPLSLGHCFIAYLTSIFDNYLTEKFKKIKIYAVTVSMQIPAATVCPMSLIANLASSGISLCFSIIIGFVGTTFMIAASPVFM
jgi:hypothetical protein